MSGIRSGSVVAALAAISFASSSILGQFEEVEPNQTCAQIEGPVAVFEDIPLEITGELSPGPVGEVLGDVDFFYFEAPGGVRLTALLSLEAEPSNDHLQMFLGLFDTNCNPLTELGTDYYASHPDGMYYRLDISPKGAGLIPFYLGVTGSNDLLLDGSHFQTGSYTLRLIELEKPVQGIQGQLIDEVSAQPIARNWEAGLYRCLGADCSHYLAQDKWAYWNTGGRFRFTYDERGWFQLDAGTYLIRIEALNYLDEWVGPFEIGPDELADLGQIEMQPVGLVFENTIPCEDLPLEGGYCIYITHLRNYANTSVEGLYWNTVVGLDWSQLGPTTYQPQRSRRVLIEPNSDTPLQSRFRVPPELPIGSAMRVYGHLSDRNFGHFSVLRSQPLFILVKTDIGFLALDPTFPGPP